MHERGDAPGPSWRAGAGWLPGQVAVQFGVGALDFVCVSLAITARQSS